MRPDHALFTPEYCLPGILRCRVRDCGELFQTTGSLGSSVARLKAQGKTTRHLPTPDIENARRRQHAEAHVRACEATFDRSTGFFLIAEHLREKPRAVTAADFGF